MEIENWIIGTDRPNSLLLAKYEIKKNLVFVSFYGKSLTQKKNYIYIYKS